MMYDPYFTDDKIEELVTQFNWEMVKSGSGKYRLRQKDSHHMTTVEFAASGAIARRFCALDNKGVSE